MRVLEGHPGRDLWPVLSVLLLAVVVPTLCVLWFMREAMRNERLAVHEKLERAYTGQLDTTRAKLNEFWWHDNAAWTELPAAAEPCVVFHNLVGNVCDSALVYDASGRLLYPNSAPAGEPSTSSEWAEAQRLEFVEADRTAAASVYAGIAETASDVTTAARAHQARARCLAKAGMTHEVLTVGTSVLADHLPPSTPSPPPHIRPTLRWQ